MVVQTSRELMAEGRRDDLRKILESVSRSLVVDERAFTTDLGGGRAGRLSSYFWTLRVAKDKVESISWSIRKSTMKRKFGINVFFT